MFPKITGFFPILLAAFCAFGAETGFTTAGGLELRFRDGRTDQKKIVSFWKENDSMLVKYFNAAPTGLSRPCRVELDENAPYSVSVDPKERTIVIKIGGAFAAFESDADAQCRVLGVILLAKYGIQATAADRLPAWIHAGLAGARRSSSGWFYGADFSPTAVERTDEHTLNYTTKYPVRRNRYYPGLRFLLAQNTLPKPARVMELAPGKMPYEVRLAAQDVCRFYLEQLFSIDKKGSLLRDCVLSERKMSIADSYRTILLPAVLTAAERDIAETAAEFAPAATEKKITWFFRRRAEMAAFNSSYPYPANLALARFREWRVTTLPPAKKDEKPRELDFSDLPSANLAEPVLALWGLRKARELDTIAEGLGDECAAAIKNLRQTLDEITACSRLFGPRKLRGMAKEIETILALCAGREKWLDGVIAEKIPTPLLLRNELKIGGTPRGTPLGSTAQKFVDAAEKRYHSGK